MEEKINVTMSLLFMSAAIVCLVAFLSFHGCVTADKSDWKVLQEDAYHNRFSYDTKSVWSARLRARSRSGQVPMPQGICMT